MKIRNATAALLMAVATAATLPAATREFVVTNAVGSWSPTYTEGDYYRYWTTQDDPLIQAALWGQGHEGLWAFYYDNFEEGVHDSDENYCPTNGVPLNVGGYLWTVDTDWVLTQYEVVTQQVVVAPDPIHADFARMFTGGGEWLPDWVPDEAIYDAPGGVGKELRYSTNVQAAAAAVISGLLERYYLADGWMGSYWPTSAIWSREAWTNEMPYEAHENMPTAAERFVGTRRAALWPRLAKVRDKVLRRARYNDVWGWPYMGSSQFPRPYGVDTEFPEFGWFGRGGILATNVLRSVRPDAEWAWVWPEFTSVDTDLVWRVDGPDLVTNHEGLWSAARFFAHGDGSSALAVLYTNTAPTTCYGILEDRFGDAADRLTNETLRLSYYGLGTLEAALAAMDTTYMQFLPPPAYLRYVDLNYTHRIGSYLEAEVEAELSRGGRLEWSLPYTEWIDEEVWTTSTNRAGLRADPLFSLCSDSVDLDASAGGTVCDLAVTFEDLREVYDTCYTVETNVWDGVEVVTTNRAARIAISYGRNANDFWIQLDAYDGLDRHLGTRDCGIDLGATNVTFTLRADVSAVRRATVVITEFGIESYAGFPPWQGRQVEYYRPRIRLNALEDYYFATNAVPSRGYLDYSDAAEDGVDFRSVLCGEFDTTNALSLAWRNAALALHGEVARRYLADPRACVLSPREVVVPLDANILAGLKRAALAADAGQLAVTWLYASVCVDYAGGGGWFYDITMTRPDGTVEYTTLDTGNQRLVLGRITVAVPVTPGSSATVETHSPFTANGSIVPATRVRWKFKNMYTGERNQP